MTRLRILVHAVFHDDQPRGVGRYAQELVRAYCYAFPGDAVAVVTGTWMSGYKWPTSAEVIPACGRRALIARNLWNLSYDFGQLVHRVNPNLVHFCDTTPVPRCGRPTVSTIHDLAEFHHTAKYGFLRSTIRRQVVGVQVRRSQSCITVSKVTRTQLAKMRAPPSQVSVIPLASPFEKRPSYENAPCSPYVLYVGAVERAKNLTAHGTSVMHCFASGVQYSSSPIVPRFRNKDSLWK